MADKVPPNTAPHFAAPIPTPSYGEGGSASAIFSTHIAAPPATVVEVLLDTTAYGWNKWIPRAVITSPPSSSSPSPSPSPATPLPLSLFHLASKPGILLPQTGFYFEVHMNPESASFRRTDLVVTVLEEFAHEGRKGIRVAWKTLGDPWYLKAERVQEFVEADGGGCEYSNYETFYGPVTWAVKTFVGGPLASGLTLFMDGLKGEAEKRAKGAQ